MPPSGGAMEIRRCGARATPRPCSTARSGPSSGRPRCGSERPGETANDRRSRRSAGRCDPSGGVPRGAGSRGAGASAPGGRGRLGRIVPRPVRGIAGESLVRPRIARGRRILASDRAGASSRRLRDGPSAAHRPLRAGRGRRPWCIRRRPPGLRHDAPAHRGTEAAPARSRRDPRGRRAVPPRGPRRRGRCGIPPSCRSTTPAESDGELYLVGDLIEGRNLADELAAPPTFRRSAEWIAALADALAHAQRWA